MHFPSKIKSYVTFFFLILSLFNVSLSHYLQCGTYLLTFIYLQYIMNLLINNYNRHILPFTVTWFLVSYS